MVGQRRNLVSGLFLAGRKREVGDEAMVAGGRRIVHVLKL
jgi:hypothetical protein